MRRIRRLRHGAFMRGRDGCGCGRICRCGAGVSILIGYRRAAGQAFKNINPVLGLMRAKRMEHRFLNRQMVMMARRTQCRAQSNHPQVCR